MDRIRRVLLAVCLAVAYVCGAAATARAQMAAGEITGFVRDQAGAAVPGATITVTETRTNRQRVVVSTADGVYTAASLAPGEYRFDIELSGFTSVRREGIRARQDPGRDGQLGGGMFADQHRCSVARHGTRTPACSS